MRKLSIGMILGMAVILFLSGCGNKTAARDETIHLAAAASLEKCMTEELIPLYQSKHPNIKIEGMYDSSGKLQTQIEEGAEVDVFFSAAFKQMDALVQKDMVNQDTITDLLENRIVLIVPSGEEGNYSEFKDLAKAESIAIGDPDSVPAGQYAKEVLSNLGLWDAVFEKASLGTNVTEVLNWVAEGSAMAGIVYATDAAQTDKVVVVDTAPEESVSKSVYPAAVLKNSSHTEAAADFLQFLKSEEAEKIFENKGFIICREVF